MCNCQLVNVAFVFFYNMCKFCIKSQLKKKQMKNFSNNILNIWISNKIRSCLIFMFLYIFGSFEAEFHDRLGWLWTHLVALSCFTLLVTFMPQLDYRCVLLCLANGLLLYIKIARKHTNTTVTMLFYLESFLGHWIWSNKNRIVWNIMDSYVLVFVPLLRQNLGTKK